MCNMPTARGPRGSTGLPFADVEQAKAAKHLIVTCETLVDDDLLRQAPDQNQIPFFCVDAVVHVPMGAYPTACYQHYDYDPTRLHQYRRAALDDDRYQAYLDSGNLPQRVMRR
jgi:glutaconate CoA-transferase subunit A